MLANTVKVVRSEFNIATPFPRDERRLSADALLSAEAPLIQGLLHSFHLLTVEEGNRNNGTPVFQAGRRTYHPDFG